MEMQAVDLPFSYWCAPVASIRAAYEVGDYRFGILFWIDRSCRSMVAVLMGEAGHQGKGDEGKADIKTEQAIFGLDVSSARRCSYYGGDREMRDWRS